MSDSDLGRGREGGRGGSELAGGPWQSSSRSTVDKDGQRLLCAQDSQEYNTHTR